MCVYACLPSFPEWTKLENCIKKIFRRIMLVWVFYMMRWRTSLWKIFKLQMHNSRTNIAYALNMQFCIMINRKIWKIDNFKNNFEKYRHVYFYRLFYIYLNYYFIRIKYKIKIRRAFAKFFHFHGLNIYSVNIHTHVFM